MGLDIYARSTKGHISGSYSTIHHTARYLALIYCGMPESLDVKDEIPAIVFYLHPWVGDKKLDADRLKDFIYAVQVSGLRFPNLLLHSDCDGTYTKRGKVCSDGSLTRGNSIQLLKELELLMNEKEFLKDKYHRAFEYTKCFYNLVKREVENGKGIIEFR